MASWVAAAAKEEEEEEDDRKTHRHQHTLARQWGPPPGGLVNDLPLILFFHLYFFALLKIHRRRTHKNMFKKRTFELIISRLSLLL